MLNLGQMAQASPPAPAPLSVRAEGAYPEPPKQPPMLLQSSEPLSSGRVLAASFLLGSGLALTIGSVALSQANAEKRDAIAAREASLMGTWPRERDVENEESELARLQSSLDSSDRFMTPMVLGAISLTIVGLVLFIRNPKRTEFQLTANTALLKGQF